MLLKTTEDLRKYVRANSVLQNTSYTPFVEDAINKYLNGVVGIELMYQLSIWNSSPIADTEAEPPVEGYTPAEGAETTEALAALLPKVESALAAFTMFLASPFMDLTVSEQGMGVINNQNIAPASKDRVAKYDAALEQLGWDRVETLLAFLEMNETDYPTWVASAAYTLQEGCFFRSALDLDDNGFDINKSRLTFKKWQNTLKEMEMLKIEPGISKELSDKIKTEIKEANLSSENKLIMPLIKRALANFAASEHVDKRYYHQGEMFLSQVKRIMDANPENYPEYAASSIYISGRTTYNTYDNEAESGVFVAGN